jgi:hypothetical protein
MLVAGVQLPTHSAGGPPTRDAASTSRQARSADQDPQSRTQGPTQATPPDPEPAVPRETMSTGLDGRHNMGAVSGTFPDQKQPSDAAVTRKKKKNKKKKHKSITSVQPDEADAAKAPDEGFSGVVGSPGCSAVSVGRACARCGVTAKGSADGKLKECSRCRSVLYCGRACQKADWAAHKATCKRPQAAQGSSICWGNLGASEE